MKRIITDIIESDLTFAAHNWAIEVMVAHLLSSGLPPLTLIPIRQWGDPETWAPFPSPADLAVALRKHYTHALSSRGNESRETANIFRQLLTVVLDQVNWDIVVARLSEDAKHRLSDAAVQGRKEFAKACQGKTWEEYVLGGLEGKEENDNIPPSVPESDAK